LGAASAKCREVAADVTTGAAKGKATLPHRVFAAPGAAAEPKRPAGWRRRQIFSAARNCVNFSETLPVKSPSAIKLR
jgi:hypothetical protein